MNEIQALRETLIEFDCKPEWGIYDCCQFVRAYIRRATGEDLGEGFEYDSPIAAARIVHEHGGMVGLLSSILGDPAAHPHAWDVVLVDIARDAAKKLLAAGIYNGVDVWTVHPEVGCVRVPSYRIQECWQCPSVSVQQLREPEGSA